MKLSEREGSQQNLAHATLDVDFDSACNLDGWIGYLLRNNSQNSLKKMKQLYEQNHFSCDKQTTVGIPKILHQIWLGPKMPNKFVRQTESWKVHHPEWDYRLWTEQDLDEIDSKYLNLINGTECYGQKSDILRIAILQKFGGLYVDVDYDCFRACDKLNDSFDFYTTMRGFPVLHMQFPDAFKNPIGICSSICGSIPNHPILNAFLEQVSDRMNTLDSIYKPSIRPLKRKANQMRVAVKTCYQLYQEIFAVVAGTTGHVDIALPPTFFNPIDTWWKLRLMMPKYYAHLPGYLINKNSYGIKYNLTKVQPYSFGHHDSHASWL